MNMDRKGYRGTERKGKGTEKNSWLGIGTNPAFLSSFSVLTSSCGDLASFFITEVQGYRQRMEPVGPPAPITTTLNFWRLSHCRQIGENCDAQEDKPMQYPR
jgi:hypothetical protein